MYPTHNTLLFEFFNFSDYSLFTDCRIVLPLVFF